MKHTSKILILKQTRIFFILLLGIFMTLSVSAIPAKRNVWKNLNLPDGTKVRAQLTGDEFGHYWLGKNGKSYAFNSNANFYQSINSDVLISKAKECRQSANERSLRRLASHREGQVQGLRDSKKGLIILVNFADNTFERSHDNALYQRIANEENFSYNKFRGSLYDYFKDQSQGLFKLSFDVIGPVTLSKNLSYYGENDNNYLDKHSSQMICEAVEQAKNLVSDWKQYDWNDDGKVDLTYVIYAGQGEEAGGEEYTIWSHSSSLSVAGASVTVGDNLIVDEYACSAELNSDKTINGIGHICFAFSNSFGLPYLYDIDYSGGQGMGSWDIMDSGAYNGDGFVPAGYTSYERWSLGWMDPIQLESENKSITGMKSLQDGGESYVIYNPNNRNEYFLLENRQKTGWDAGLPGSGMLILHCDYDETAWSNNQVNDDPEHQRLTWIPADNKYDYELYNGNKYYTDEGMASDTYPHGTNNRFNKYSEPASKLYNQNLDGSYFLNSSVENITQNANGTISFDFLATVNAEPYVVLDGTTLTFYYDNQKSSRNGMDVGPFQNADYRGWNSYAGNITKVVFDSSMDSYTDLTSTAFWFWEFTNLEEVVDIKYLHTDNVTSMESMFGIWGGTGSTPYTGKLPAVDMTHFNTSKVVNMNGVFTNCAALTTLDLSSFDTSSVTDMSTMFSGCTGLTTIYVGSGWTTANVTNGSIMFQDCTSLVGGAGTTYDASHTDAEYARIDGGPNSQTPGYFTAKSTASNLEIFSVDKTVTYVPNQSITPTPSITMTPGNDAEWLTDLAIGLTNTTTGESDDPLQFTASIYYPNSTETFSYLDAMRGTLNPRDGDLTTNAETGAIDNTGTQYIPGYNNVPRSGSFIAYEALQDGSLIIPIRVTSNKSLFVVEDDGHVKTDIQFKDADGNTLTLLPSPLCAVSSEYVMGFLSFNVEQGRKYYVFCNGSKPRFAGYVFSTERITIDSETMKDVLDLLLPLTPQDVEVFAIDATTELMPNEPLQATRSVTMTPGNDSAWGVRLLEDNKHALKFTASSYYPGSTSSYTFWGGARGTNPAKDGDLTEGGNSGDAYDYTIKNTPKSGAYVTFEVSQSGSLIIPMHVPTNKPLYVIDSNGKVKTDIQFVDTLGQVVPMLAEPLCVFSETASTPGYLSFNVTPGGKYTIFITGGVDLRYGGYVFSTESITIDPVTMANVKSILEASVSTALDTDFASGIGDWTIVDATTLPEGLTYIWKYDEPNKYMKASAYASGKSYASDSWLISPAFTLASEGAMTVSHTQRYAASGCTDLHIMVSSTYAGGAINASEWTEVTPDQWPDGTNWLFINSAATIPAGTTRIAFRYTSTESTAGTWEIKSVSIKGQALPSAVKPTFSWNGDQLTMTTETDGADIYYSVKEYEAEPAGDGSESNPYNVAGVLKYISTLGADVQSEQEVYVKGVVSLISSQYDTTYGNGIFCISDNGGNHNNLKAYQALYLQNQKYSDDSQRKIQVGDDVVLCGKVVNYKGNTPETVSRAAYLYSMEEPDLQNRYENPITVSGNVVIRAKATMQGMEDSGLAMTYSGTEPYAVLSDNNTVLTFRYDDQKRANGGMGVGPFGVTFINDENAHNVTGREWEDYVSTIRTVAFDPSFANCSTIFSTAGWFCNDSNLVAIRGIEYLNTDNVMDMTGMFCGCKSLTSIDLSHFNTSNVTNMWAMFNRCESFTTFNLEQFNTSKVTDMRGMFYGCSSLTNLDLSHFDVSKVIYFNSMFRECTKLENLNLTGWRTSSAQVMQVMFGKCESLKSIDLSGFDTSNATNLLQMFYGCRKLKSLDLSNFKTPKVTAMHGLFYRCEALESLDISSLNPSEVTDLHSIFFGCTSLKNLDVSHFETSKATNMDYLFARCYSLTNLNISGFNTADVTSMANMFNYCSSLASIQAGNAVIPDSVYAQIGNPNLLLYVNEASLAPSSVTNVVVNGAAENIVLTDVEQGNNNFYCPQEFTAHRISYTHNYRQATQVGVSRGWETIVLPFTVQTITHEKNGLLAPFGVDGGKPFWLRQLTENGLVSAQQIEANMPYLISMPNNGRYPADYNQAGNVTFSATNVVVPMTEQREMSGNNRMLIPTTMRVAQSPSVYAINRNASYENNPEGSIFVADYREVRPFEAYVEHTNGARFISLDDLSEGDVTNIQAIHDIASADVVKVYNLSGVLLKTGKRQEVMSQLSKGIYIVNGVKVVVK